MDTPTLPKIPMTAITDLSVDDLVYLCEWSGSRLHKFACFAKWLFETVQAEAIRRQSDGCIEAGDIEPPDFDAALLSDGLIGAYTLSRQALPASLATFADQIELHIVTASSALLGEFAERITVQ